jgi:hypothetical protein
VASDIITIGVYTLCTVKAVFGAGYERSHLDTVKAFPPPASRTADDLQHEERSVHNARTNRSIIVEKRTTWCPVLAARPSEYTCSSYVPVAFCRSVSRLNCARCLLSRLDITPSTYSSVSVTLQYGTVNVRY